MSHRRLFTDRAFARWADVSCPPVVEILRATSAALSGQTARDLDGELDELARRLFGATDPAAAVIGLLCEVPGFAVDEVTADGLRLDRVLETRTGHPLMLAVVLAEAARRAGFAASILSSPGRWYAGVRATGDRAVLIAPADPACRRPPGMVRRHCGHEIALASLVGLARIYRDEGDDARADHARAMLARLGFDEEEAITDPLHVLWTPT